MKLLKKGMKKGTVICKVLHVSRCNGVFFGQGDQFEFVRRMKKIEKVLAVN